MLAWLLGYQVSAKVFYVELWLSGSGLTGR